MTYREREDGRKWARCNTCRTRRSSLALLTQHLKEHPECLPCDCGGYGFSGGLTKHTRGSTYCIHHRYGLANQASRAGCSEAEFQELRARCDADRECPF